MLSAGTQRESWNQPGEAGLSPQSGCATRRSGDTASPHEALPGSPAPPPGLSEPQPGAAHVWGCTQVAPGLGLFQDLAPGSRSHPGHSPQNQTPWAGSNLALLSPWAHSPPRSLGRLWRKKTETWALSLSGDPSRVLPHSVFLEPQHSLWTPTKQLCQQAHLPLHR